MSDEQAPLTGRTEQVSPPGQQTGYEKANADEPAIYEEDVDNSDGNGAVRQLDARPGGALLTSYIFHGSLCGGFFGLGIVLCMLGPTLLDLADQASGASVREVTLLFTSRSFAYLLGSILGGYLLETMENTCAMLAAAMWLVAVGSAGLPLCSEIWSMGCFMACAGTAMYADCEPPPATPLIGQCFLYVQSHRAALCDEMKHVLLSQGVT